LHRGACAGSRVQSLPLRGVALGSVCRFARADPPVEGGGLHWGLCAGSRVQDLPLRGVGCTGECAGSRVQILPLRGVGCTGACAGSRVQILPLNGVGCTGSHLETLGYQVTDAVSAAVEEVIAGGQHQVDALVDGVATQGFGVDHLFPSPEDDPFRTGRELIG
jgi:hypothetical protein